MQQLLLIAGLLLAYTFIYVGVSYIWQGVTVAPLSTGGIANAAVA